MRHLIISALICVVVTFSFSHTSHADSKKDFEAISRTISFIKGGPKGAVIVDVLYDPNNPTSEEHADTIINILSNGVGSVIKLTGNKISSLDDISSRIIFITRNSKPDSDSLIAKAAQNNGVTVSTDESCLGNGCVVVVKTQPSVDIFVSIDAANKTGTEFATAFSMMITKK